MNLTSDDPREALESLRSLLAERILDAEPRETAPLAKQLSDVIARLAELPSAQKSEVDDLAHRRAKRRAGVPDGSAPRVQRGKRGD